MNHAKIKWFSRAVALCSNRTRTTSNSEFTYTFTRSIWCHRKNLRVARLLRFFIYLTSTFGRRSQNHVVLLFIIFPVVVQQWRWRSRRLSCCSSLCSWPLDRHFSKHSLRHNDDSGAVFRLRFYDGHMATLRCTSHRVLWRIFLSFWVRLTHEVYEERMVRLLLL